MTAVISTKKEFEKLKYDTKTHVCVSKTEDIRGRVFKKYIITDSGYDLANYQDLVEKVELRIINK